MEERLQKILAGAGVASRRKCEELILGGKVQVNGETVTALGTKADPDVDEITVNGKAIGTEKKMYLVFNKPKGVITSASDPQGRKIVTDYLKGITERLYPVGRLDYDTEGLLLLTNDGEFAHLLTHPKHHVAKTYLATVKGVPHGSELDKLKNGIMLEDGMTAPAEVEYHDIDSEQRHSTISITIYEGRNRQVRRMFEAINHPVTKLKRISFGDLFLGNMKRGLFRHLTKDEVESLVKLAKQAGKSSAGKPALKSPADSHAKAAEEFKPKPRPKARPATKSANDRITPARPASGKPASTKSTAKPAPKQAARSSSRPASKAKPAGRAGANGSRSRKAGDSRRRGK
ncbi:pseudouridine synthase [Paenibacillus sp. MSJ-6]|uniref:Pseudouridine synthase n=1 Tax=Paenibacillus brevis TaxID=2841508 RepID=A0ABS6FRR4_9BACL|nr:pseudouridine synthase [Paenibacillus brevis]